MKRFFKLIVHQLFLIIIFTTPIFASTITQTYNFSGVPNYSNTYTFSQFNPATGILNSIEISLNLSITGGCLKVDNDGISALNGTANFGAKGSLSSSDVALINDSSLSPWQNLNSYSTTMFNLASDNGDGVTFDSSATDGGEYNGVSASAGITDFVKSDLYAAYEGNGTYNITLSVDQYIQFAGLSGISYAANPVNTSGSLTVKYSYTPEPATIVLLGCGCIALLHGRKR